MNSKKKIRIKIEDPKIDNIDDILKDIFEKYGQLYNEYYQVKKYLKEKYPKISDQKIKKIENELCDKLNESYNGIYKNIMIAKYNDEFYFHISKTNMNMFRYIDGVFNGIINIKNVCIMILLFFLVLTCTIAKYSFDIPSEFFWGVVFTIISIRLISIYGLEIIFIITATYILVKNILLILNSVGVIYLPYIEYFDPNAYIFSLILVCFIISIPLLINVLFILCGIPSMLIKIKKGHNVISYNEVLNKLENLWFFFNDIKNKYEVLLLRLTSIRGISGNLFLANNKKMFMSFYIITSLIFIIVYRLDTNMFYYKKNNNYCTNIGENVMINSSHKNNNMVYLLSHNKKYNYNQLYSFNYFGENNYIYETLCERKFLDVNNSFYTVNDIINGLAPKNRKIIVQGLLVKDSIETDNEYTTFKIKSKYKDESIELIYENNKFQIENKDIFIIASVKNLDNKFFEISKMVVLDKNNFQDIYEIIMKNNDGVVESINDLAKDLKIK